MGRIDYPIYYVLTVGVAHSKLLTLCISIFRHPPRMETPVNCDQSQNNHTQTCRILRHFLPYIMENKKCSNHQSVKGFPATVHFKHIHDDWHQGSERKTWPSMASFRPQVWLPPSGVATAPNSDHGSAKWPTTHSTQHEHEWHGSAPISA